MQSVLSPVAPFLFSFVGILSLVPPSPPHAFLIHVPLGVPATEATGPVTGAARPEGAHSCLVSSERFGPS